MAVCVLLLCTAIAGSLVPCTVCVLACYVSCSGRLCLLIGVPSYVCGWAAGVGRLVSDGVWWVPGACACVCTLCAAFDCVLLLGMLVPNCRARPSIKCGSCHTEC